MLIFTKMVNMISIIPAYQHINIVIVHLAKSTTALDRTAGVAVVS